MKHLASPWARLLAYILDSLVSLAMVLILIILTNDLILALALIFIIGIVYLFLTGYLISRFGGTLGKIISGIRIVVSGDNTPSFWLSIFRQYIGYIVSGLLLWVGFIWIFIDKERRGWHDQISNTYVIVVRKSGWILGLISLVILIILNTLLAQKLYTHYQQLLLGFKQELQNPPSSTLQTIESDSGKLRLQVPPNWSVSDLSKTPGTAGQIFLWRLAYPKESAVKTYQVTILFIKHGLPTSSELTKLQKQITTSRQKDGFELKISGPIQTLTLSGQPALRINFIGTNPSGQSQESIVYLTHAENLYQFYLLGYGADKEGRLKEIDYILNHLEFF